MLLQNIQILIRFSVQQSCLSLYKLINVINLGTQVAVPQHTRRRGRGYLSLKHFNFQLFRVLLMHNTTSSNPDIKGWTTTMSFVLLKHPDQRLDEYKSSMLEAMIMGRLELKFPSYRLHPKVVLYFLGAFPNKAKIVQPSICLSTCAFRNVFPSANNESSKNCGHLLPVTYLV